MKCRKQTRIYNVIFPIWLLWILPMTWIVILPANYIIDLLVVVLTMKYLKISNIKEKAKNVIFRVWIMGFVADFAGVILMYLSNAITFDYGTEFGKWWVQSISNAVSYNPFDNIYSFLWVTLSVFVVAVCIYILNDKWCLKQIELEETERKKVALSLAVFTAPYLFYFPTKWFF